MKKIRTLTALLLAAVLCFGCLAGCGSAMPEEETAPTEAGRSNITAGLNPAQGDAGKRLTPLTTRTSGTAQTKEYTIMVYMVGSDLESQGGYASSDILEMLESGMTGRNSNLLVYTGGATSWELNIPSNVNTVYALNESGDTLEEVASTGRSVNMGEADTLLDFLNYARDNYPAEKYGLIFWDHGGGPLYGFGSDELYGYDGLSIWELQDALGASGFSGNKLEFIGFDACLMASIEVAAMLSDYAKYMIASEEVEPGSGWDYSFLKTLNTTSDTTVLLQSILEAYRVSMETNFWKPDYTLSCVDLSMLMTAVDSMAGVWEKMRGDLEAGGYADLADSRNQTKRFGISAVSDRGSSFDLVDVGDMLSKLGSGYEALTDQVLQGLEASLVGHVTNVESASGLSMYYPYDNKNLYQQGGNLFDFSEFLTGYHSYMDLFASQWLTDTGDLRWNDTQSIETRDGYLVLQLEEEQLQELCQVTYTILKYVPQYDAYCALLTDYPVSPNQEGEIRIPRNPDVFMMHTDAEYEGFEGVLWSVTLAEPGMTRNRYVSSNSCLLTSQEVIAGGTEPIQITFCDDLAAGEVRIQSVLSRSWADAAFFGRQDVSIENYGAVAYDWHTLFPTYDQEGNLLPWQQWEGDGTYWLTMCNYGESFWFEKTSLQALEGEYYCQVVMKDASGNVIGTRLEELCINLPYEDEIMDFGEYSMTFRLYEDHAELKSFHVPEDADTFTYKDLEVTVPGTVDGLPVTVIGSEAFRACMDIAAVTLPDSVEEIEYCAFSSCYNLVRVDMPASLRVVGSLAFGYTDLAEVELPEGLEVLGCQSFISTCLTEVTLPASLELVGSGSFACCHDLAAIHVAAGNEAYRSVDGVLFSADGRVLLAYPEARGERYEVPDGVLCIGAEAFRGNDTLTVVDFPEGLTEVGMLAFYDSIGLLYLDLPESLEVIGSGAFGCFSIYHDDEPVELGTLNIGSNVRWIGDDAFSGYIVREYLVAEGNEFYSSDNGCLLNASGTRLIQAPYCHDGELVVPDGVSYIDGNAFDCSKGMTGLVLPDSLVSINFASGVPTGLKSVTIGKGLADWQNVTSYYTVADIQLSAENPHYEMSEDGSIYTEDMTVLLLCRSEAEEFSIPEGVTEIGVGALKNLYGDAATMKVLKIPASVETLPENGFSGLMALERFEVAEDNPFFASCDGLLYTKDGTTLVACPLGRTGTVQVREGTVEIGAYAFCYGGNLKATEVMIPEGVTILRAGNFSSAVYNSVLSLYLPASLTDIHQDLFEYVDADEIIVYCPGGSEAQAWAEAAGLTVVITQ